MLYPKKYNFKYKYSNKILLLLTNFNRTIYDLLEHLYDEKRIYHRYYTLKCHNCNSLKEITYEKYNSYLTKLSYPRNKCENCHKNLIFGKRSKKKGEIVQDRIKLKLPYVKQKSYASALRQRELKELLELNIIVKYENTYSLNYENIIELWPIEKKDLNPNEINYLIEITKTLFQGYSATRLGIYSNIEALFEDLILSVGGLSDIFIKELLDKNTENSILKKKHKKIFLKLHNLCYKKLLSTGKLFFGFSKPYLYDFSVSLRLIWFDSIEYKKYMDKYTKKIY